MRFDTTVELLIKLTGDEHWWTLGEFASAKSANLHLDKLITEAHERGQDIPLISFICLPATQDWAQPDLPWE